MEVLTSLLVAELPIEVVGERLVVRHLVELERHQARVGADHLVATAAAVAALDLLHLGDFLLGLGLRDHFVQVLVRIVKNHNWSILLSVVHQLHLLFEDLVFLLLIEDLVLLAYLLHNVEVDQFLRTSAGCRVLLGARVLIHRCKADVGRLLRHCRIWPVIVSLILIDLLLAFLELQGVQGQWLFPI